jgi:hypothetical protein
MFIRFLQIIQAGEVASLQDIAHKLDIPPGLASQMALLATQLGYLQAVNSGCDDSDQPCGDCAAGSACHTAPKRWVLTEKGRTLSAGR